MTESAKGVGAGEILKRDARGRVQSTVEQRRAVLAEFERSGLSGPRFARAAGMPYQTFASWRQRLGKPKDACGESSVQPAPKSRAVALRLVEAVVCAESGMPPKAGEVAERALEVLLPGGARLLVASPAQATLAASLIQALERPC